MNDDDRLAREPDGDPARVKQVTGRFAAPVWMPSTLAVSALGVEETTEGRRLAFDVRTRDGGFAIRDGGLLLSGGG